MSSGEWIRGPFGLDAVRGQTLRCERTVLVVTHHLTSATRLADDVAPLLEPDQRVQVVFTVAPNSMFSGGTDQYLGDLGGVVVPWRQATQTSFDLALTASAGSLEQLHAPVLSMAHGAGRSKFPARWHGTGPLAPRETTGLEQAGLVYRGRVIPARIVVATAGDEERLRDACPPAGPLAVLAGDPCYDRLAASLPLRETYRRALGLDGRKLVAVTSTWGPGSLFEQRPGLPGRLAAELPGDEYRVALFLHPHVWTWHGRRQVHAWAADGIRDGLLLVPPEQGWRAVLAAADYVVGDHGSATSYGGAAGAPVLLASFPDGEVDPDSLASYLRSQARLLRPGRPLEPQLRDAAAAWDPAAPAGIRSRITDVPGRSAQLLRRVMYQLMRLPEPASPARTRPVSADVPRRPVEIAGASR